MGLVLAFETAPRAAPRPQQRRNDPAPSADILFFTGVRYEKRRPAPPPTSGSASPAAAELPSSS